MRDLKALALGIFLTLASFTGAFAQCGTQAPANKFCGNDTGSAALATWKSIPAGALTAIAGGTVLGNPTGALAVPVATTAPVLGIPGTSTGQVGLAGLSSGTAILRAQSVAGSAVSLLPTAAGTLVGTASSPLLIGAATGTITCPTCVTSSGGGAITGAAPIAVSAAGVVSINAPYVTLTASNGGIVYSGATNLAILNGTATARQMLQSGASTAPAWSTAVWPATTTISQLLYADVANNVTGLATANGGILNTSSTGVPSITATPLLGVAGTTMGTLRLSGSTSGVVTITPQATAGTVTMTLPNTSGTFAVGASGPLVLSATTGGLTCPTCVTSSGGGAITGTAPIAASAAGVISITGAAGQVLAGASPAFTATPVLGVAGATVGSLGFQNATSGTETITPATGALASGVATLPAGTYNLVGDSLTQTLTGKTITSTTNTLGTVTMGLGSDATGDIYYRNASGFLTRLPIGSSTNVLAVSGGLPAWTAPGAGGTVTSLTPGGGQVSSTTASCSQTAITTVGTISSAECVNPQSGTSYALADGDRAKLITATNAAAQAYSIAQAGAASNFQAGWYVDVSNISTNAAGIVTITPTTSTINGASTLKIYQGQSVRIISDGTNYQTKNQKTLPTTQAFVSGSGTYTTPAGVLWIEVKMCAAGGGGGGGGTGGGSGGVGGNTTFSTFTANGGLGGLNAAGSPGTGGTATGGTTNTTGGAGSSGSQSFSATVPGVGGNGGGSIFGAGGYGLQGASTAGSGVNYCGGGGGGGVSTAVTASAGGGGGAGGGLYGIINNPAATYSYATGAAGTAGTAGTSGGAAGAGGGPYILVVEHYGT